MSRDTASEILLTLLRGEQPTEVTPDAWTAVAALVGKQWLGPLLFSRLKSLGIAEQVPTDVLQGLRSQYLYTAQKNARIFHQLSILLEKFQSESIPCIPLKGAYLAEHVYGNIAVRPMTDLDLLVKESDIARVERIIQPLGFKGPLEADESPEERDHHSYEHPESGHRIEIHWTLIHAARYGIQVDIDTLWERSRGICIAGVPAREMAPEDLVLHLCTHISTHLKSEKFRWTWVCDLTETLRTFESALDWECLAQRGSQWAADRCLYLNLQLAKNLLNAPVPDDLLSRLTPLDLDPRYMIAAETELFRIEGAAGKIWYPSAEFAQFLAAKSPMDKLRLLWGSFFPSRQAMATMYPARPGSVRIFLYYPVRLWDLLRRYCRVLWHLFRGDDQVRARVEHPILVKALRGWLLPRYLGTRPIVKE